MKKLFISVFAIFATALSSNAATLSVMDYGAINSRTSLSTKAIQSAIDACAATGGGTVVVPPGEYLSGTIEMRSNITLCIEAGATIYSSLNLDDFRSVSDMKRDNGGSRLALISALNVNNIAICGRGSLNGQAKREQIQRERPATLYDITYRGDAAGEKYGVDFKTKYRVVAPWTSLVFIKNCDDVKIQDVKIIESPGWTLHIQWCERVYVNGIFIQSSRVDGVNSDGIDIDGSQRVTISDCIVDTGDDALCLKTSNDENRSEACEDIVVSNCVFSSSSAAIKLGTESYGDFRRISVNNCTVNDANRGINIILRDGGTVSDVRFSNITIQNQRRGAFWWGNGDAVWIYVVDRNIDNPAKISPRGSGQIDGVWFDNITARTQGGITIEGVSSQIKNISLNNVSLFMENEVKADKRSKHGFEFINIDGLVLRGCSLEWDTKNPEPTWENAFSFTNVKNIRIRDLYAAQEPSHKFAAVNFSDVDNLTIALAQIGAGADSFFSFGGDYCTNVQFANIFAGDCKTPYSYGPKINKKGIVIK